MRTPTPGATIIQHRGSNSPLLKSHNCRRVAANRREMDEAKKITANKGGSVLHSTEANFPPSTRDEERNYDDTSAEEGKTGKL